MNGVSRTLRATVAVALALAVTACTGTVAGPYQTGVGSGAAPGSPGAGGMGTNPGGTGAQGGSPDPGTGSGSGGSSGVPGGAGGPGAAGSAGSGGAGAFTSTAPVGTPTLMRLGIVQWANTVRDLLKLPNPGALETELTPDAALRFDNEADSLYIDQALHDDLQTVTERLAAQVAGDPAAIARLIPAGAPTDTAGKARAFIQDFGRRAYRRPLTPVEVQEHLTLFNQGPMLTTGMGVFEAGLRVTLEAVLQSPHFLYRTAFGGAVVQDRARLTEYEIASNISYALANTMPDAELSLAAEMGALKTPDAISTHARRLLASASGKAAVDRFYFQFFGLGQYETLQKNPTVAPKFVNVGPVLRAEAQQFLQYLFGQNKGLRDIFTSPVGLVNSATAGIYGLTGTFAANSWTQVTFDPQQRPGLLTRLGFLAYYGHDGLVQDSIHRGANINQRILCRQMVAPENVVIAPLPPPDPTKTNRQLVEGHTGQGTCGGACHATFINPAGFAFENFDGVGTYRTTENGKPIDASGTYPFADGSKSFKNVAEFMQVLADSAQAHSCYATTWAANLYSRIPRRADEIAAHAVAEKSRTQNISTLDLIVALMADDAFVHRVQGGP